MPTPNRRYLFFVHSYPPHEYTGVPLRAKNFATALAARGHAVGVVYPALEDLSFGRFERADAEGSVVLYEVPCSELKWVEWSIYDSLFFDRLGEQKEAILRNILDEFRPDVLCVVDTVNLPCRWLAVLVGSGLPIMKFVVNGEDLCGLIEPFDRDTFSSCPVPLLTDECIERSAAVCAAFDRSPDLKSRIRTALERKRRISSWCYSEVYDLLLFPADGLKDLFVRTLDLEDSRCAVLGPGVVLPGRRSPQKRSPDPSKVRFGYVGSLSVRKGIGLLSDVFRSEPFLARDDYELAFHGNGDETLLESLRRANTCVRYAGAYTPEDLPGILENIDVGILPSYFEGGHKAIREMLACDVPVIASTVFGNPEVVRHGVNGFLFPVGDREKLKTLILGVLDDKSSIVTLQEGAALTRVRSLEEEIEEFIGLAERVSTTRKQTGGSALDMRMRMTAGERPSSGNTAGPTGDEILVERAMARVRDLERVVGESNRTVEGKSRYILKLQQEFDDRSAWALQLNAELEHHRERIGSLQGEFEERTAWALSLEEERKRLELRIQELDFLREMLDQRLNAIKRSYGYRFLAFLGLVPK